MLRVPRPRFDAIHLELAWLQERVSFQTERIDFGQFADLIASLELRYGDLSDPRQALERVSNADIDTSSLPSQSLS